ncbi:MAG: hypothetical protein JSW71_22320 [Gemmatimonadota bacterium]|nr:MAG: hypothetical protein JSW71_22320 [Gemmatimonadota bacterium]
MRAHTKGGGAISEKSEREHGRISFASVPFEKPSWRRSLLTPVILASNVLLGLWIYPCWRTARITWIPSLDGLTRLSGDSGRPIIFYSWHAYEPLTLCAFRDFPSELQPTGIGHDGVLSRMLQRTTTWLGFRVWVYRRKSPVRPKQQIINMVNTRRCNIGLFADAGGPYRRVKPGLPEIAHATASWLVPVVVRGRPALRLSWPRRYGFPLPFCRLVACHGEPIDGLTATVDRCQEALEQAEAEAMIALERDS